MKNVDPYACLRYYARLLNVTLLELLATGDFSWNKSIVGQLFHLIVLTPTNIYFIFKTQSFPSFQNEDTCLVAWVAPKVTHGPVSQPLM